MVVIGVLIIVESNKEKFKLKSIIECVGVFVDGSFR